MSENQKRQQPPVGKLLQCAANRFRRLGDENLAKHGITFSQLRVLAMVSVAEREERVLHQKDLEQAFEIRRSSVTGMLQTMEKNGLLVREKDLSDARIKRVHLTEKGRELDRKLRQWIRDLEEEMLGGFSSEERDLLRQMLFRIGERLEEMERKDL